ncbi:hypothetical protein C9374_011079 [Naegleria lovaniensis]|uniref:Uncharacterized protein n=1 Tax=Naegleria lovaniensis TaxID=51637 RepID=A0AA88KIT8_NAELO|nr:uncharacterized protein C9374_011079 [Naegleria lovaniensis]KAG2374242.1 hypothetical protein C9374_011079 [Naegleria lovaniensis]
MRHLLCIVVTLTAVIYWAGKIHGEPVQNNNTSTPLTDYEKLAANDFKDLLLSDVSKRYTLDTFESGVWRIGDIQYFDSSCNALRFPFAQLTSTGDSITISNPLRSDDAFTLKSFIKRPMSSLYNAVLTSKGKIDALVCANIVLKDSTAKIAFNFAFVTCGLNNNNIETFTPSCELDSQNQVQDMVVVYENPGTVASGIIAAVVIVICLFFLCVACFIGLCVCCCCLANRNTRTRQESYNQF